MRNQSIKIMKVTQKSLHERWDGLRTTQRLNFFPENQINNFVSRQYILVIYFVVKIEGKLNPPRWFEIQSYVYWTINSSW